MKHLNIILFLCLSYIHLTAQNDTTKNDCIDFNEWNICYFVDYKPKNEKAGTICSINDLLINPSVEILSFDLLFSFKGEIFSSRNHSLKTSYMEIIFSMLKKLDTEEKIRIVFENIKVNIKGEALDYPNITLSNCN